MLDRTRDTSDHQQTPPATTSMMLPPAETISMLTSTTAVTTSATTGAGTVEILCDSVIWAYGSGKSGVASVTTGSSSSMVGSCSLSSLSSSCSCTLSAIAHHNKRCEHLQLGKTLLKHGILALNIGQRRRGLTVTRLEPWTHMVSTRQTSRGRVAWTQGASVSCNN